MKYDESKVQQQHSTSINNT